MKNDAQRPKLLAGESTELDTTKLTATAYHEAGHAVMALVLGRSIEKVTISPARLQTGGSRLGACRVQKGRFKASKDALEDDVLILLAGMVAESHFTGRYCEEGAAQDLRAVRRLLARRANSDRSIERLTRRLLDRTEHVLRASGHAQAIQTVSRELLQKETITGRAVRHLLTQAVQCWTPDV
jgi:ATP-dependent Zn protease